MAELLDYARSCFEGSIDFEGQRKAEQYTNWLIPGSALIAFVVGFILQDLRITMGIYATGFLTTLLVVVPPWNMYRQNPIKWLPAQSVSEGQDTSIVKESKKKR
ncbi:SPC12-domain-containing protein [Cystobasidium minutum MCA 4210]|uniref:SPC12-domain-containing protein n=1 Tax=Cystobasidium minutum MCA 4210 TaxID=1397322 RepID=UPI0034CED388|eukprot:jgi/Rhomi1/7892/CE7891_703